MIYAFRGNDNARMLVEFRNKAELDGARRQIAAPWEILQVSAEEARRHVKRGHTHETALYIGLDGKVKRAGSPEGYL